ncbi:DUF1638 domain-containing protein [Methanosarcina sp. Mfa9]|uniref:DUF1638 domain-containing protein n=1 Tax=Methanosarcina sp. Mfa9 TaxID=3439063 RepID=UPI003F82D10D
MPVMTIIGCRIFEDEVVHLIEKGPELEEVIVVENENNVGVIRKLEEIGVPHKSLPLEKIPRLSERKNSSGFTLIVMLLEFALDGVPEKLREKVYETIAEMQEYSDGILLFYGLCGNVLGSIEKDFAASECPVFILKDREGSMVDDCIGAVLGGREGFLSKLASNGAGTYFLTPVGAVYWKEMLIASRVTPEPENVEMTKMIFDISGYRKVAQIDTGLYYEREFEAKVREFADLYGFEIINIKGSPELVEECYKKARKEVLRRKKE